MARNGGDEFVVVCDDISVLETEQMAERRHRDTQQAVLDLESRNDYHGVRRHCHLR